MAVDVVADGHDELFEILEDSTPDAVFGQVAEEALDHVQPRGRGGREVHVEALVASHPALHALMFMGRVVVADDVDLLLACYGLVDQAQELEPLVMTVALLAQVVDLAGGGVERGKTTDIGIFIASILVLVANQNVRRQMPYKGGALIAPLAPARRYRQYPCRAAAWERRLDQGPSKVRSIPCFENPSGQQRALPSRRQDECDTHPHRPKDEEKYRSEQLHLFAGNDRVMFLCHERSEWSCSRSLS